MAAKELAEGVTSAKTLDADIRSNGTVAAAVSVIAVAGTATGAGKGSPGAIVPPCVSTTVFGSLTPVGIVAPGRITSPEFSVVDIKDMIDFKVILGIFCGQSEDLLLQMKS